MKHLDKEQTEMLDRVSTRSKATFQRFDFDIVLKYIGSTGKYQFLLVCLAFYIAIPIGMNQVASVFLAAIPKHRCKISQLDDYRELHQNLTEELIWELSVPKDHNEKYDGCRRYTIESNCTEANFSECFTNITIPCDAGYIYDRTNFDSTIVTEWDVVCDRLIFGTVSVIVYFAGVCINSVVGGNLSDRFGRTRVMVVAQVSIICLGIGCSFSNNLIMFSAIRFGIACCVIATWEAAFVYMIEIIGDKWRTPVGISIQGVFAAGYMILSGMSYYLREWRDLERAIAIVSCVFPFIWIFLPESPRWLFSKGQTKEAKAVSERMAKRNGRKLPYDIWDRAVIDEKDETFQAQYYPHELFRRRLMRSVTLRMMFVWFVCSLVYYGLSLNVGQLAGDSRVNNALGGLCEILSCPLAIFTIDKFGRTPVLCWVFITSGFACVFSTVANYFSAAIPALGIVGTVFALLGKLGISAVFGIIYNYTAELFPTVVRATAVGTGSMSARIGGMCSPLVLLVQYSIPWLPGVVFGVLSLFAGVMSLYLPETRNALLTTTLDDAEQFYRKCRMPTTPEKHDNGYDEKMKWDEKNNERL